MAVPNAEPFVAYLLGPSSARIALHALTSFAMAGKLFLLYSTQCLGQIAQASSFCSFLSHCRSMQFLAQPADSKF